MYSDDRQSSPEYHHSVQTPLFFPFIKRLSLFAVVIPKGPVSISLILSNLTLRLQEAVPIVHGPLTRADTGLIVPSQAGL